MAKAVILLSGGMDSATCLAIARQDGFECYGLSFDYGQRHRAELDAASTIAEKIGTAEYRVVALDLGELGGSALTDRSIDIPDFSDLPSDGVPVTYVPARNTVFLSYALGWAEVLDADRIYVGVNAIDYSGYPDCRPAYIEAFQKMANLATRRGVEGCAIQINTPLIDLTKSEIVQLGTGLGVDYGLTVSCYQADDQGRACGRCDACRLRARGFKEAGWADPTRYQRPDLKTVESDPT